MPGVVEQASERPGTKQRPCIILSLFCTGARANFLCWKKKNSPVFITPLRNSQLTSPAAITFHQESGRVGWTSAKCTNCTNDTHRGRISKGNYLLPPCPAASSARAGRPACCSAVIHAAIVPSRLCSDASCRKEHLIGTTPEHGFGAWYSI